MSQRPGPGRGIHALREALRSAPGSGSGELHNRLGTALRDAGDMHEAARHYRAAMAATPCFAEAANNLGNTLADLGDTSGAERAYRLALEWQPARAEIHSNLGNLLKNRGAFAQAQAAYRTAIELDPGFTGAHSNLVLAMHHDLRLDNAAILQEACRFGDAAESRAGAPLARAREPCPGRPVRVGLVSGDLRNHPVGHFLEGWLRLLDPSKVALLAYETTGRIDALSQRINPAFAEWTCIAGLSDEAAAIEIHNDGIDVLLDLAGHTAYNRLGVFAWRPAPVQASWLGYFASTGMASMDWVLADRASVPQGHEHHFRERVWLLPETRLCFCAPREAPPVSPPPAMARGFVTFGSFQNLGKFNDAVSQVWARTLLEVPNSRLRLQNPQLADPAVRDGLAARMHRLGVDPSRITMLPRASYNAYLAAHAEVDVILDTFPYPGGTTTCEALWMGVPTVTLLGDRMLSRQGAALLAAAGQHDCIAQTPRQFVDKAATLAGNVARLAECRAGQRAQVARSPLFDGQRFAAAFGDAMQRMARHGT